MGVCLYDPVSKVGGLGHIMLPKYPAGDPKENKYRFADTCISEMIREMERLGGYRGKMVAKIAGGAKMFEVSGDSAFGNIGRRNVMAVKAMLAWFKIPIRAEDTGLNYGRTVYFYTENGSMIVKSFANGICTY